MVRRTLAFSLVALATTSLLAIPANAEPGYHPWYRAPNGVRTLDMSQLQPVQAKTDAAPRRFEDLDHHWTGPAPSTATSRPGPSQLPDGWVQRGNVVLPAPVASGELVVDPHPSGAFEDIPGNKYPRKHTLYLNFVGGPLLETFGGLDNSAEDISVLALGQDYPGYSEGQQNAIAIAEATANDLADHGVRVVYLERPPQMLPYTMSMMGGTWQDTNIDGPAGGVAPTADCGALNQRHIVFVFTGEGMTPSSAANVASQEAGHAWGLDHTLNCSSVMSYCGGFSDQSFSTECDTLCETQCQGPNTIGCRLAHEEICGAGSDQQNDAAELTFLFGGNEPDVEPPLVQIDEPADGLEVEAGGDVALRAVVDDNYGGIGWSTTIERDGEILLDEIDYTKDDIGEDFRVAFNLSALPSGVYTITVTAMDQAEQVTSDTVTIFVGVEAEDETGSVDSTGEPPAGTMDDGDTEAPGSEGSVTGTEQDGTGDQGCGCQASGDRAPWERGGLLWLGVVALWRRRRAR